MVDHDLRKLSARIEALRPDVDEAYKRIDAKWAKLAAHFKKLPIPCTVGYAFHHCPYSEDIKSLDWRKFNGKWRFCITLHFQDVHPNEGPYWDVKVTPFEEWSAENRIEMLRHIPKLFESAEKEIKEFIDKTRDEEVEL